MEIFVRVVDAGSFSAAASQLGVGQPAVSKAVAQLEERLGVRLLLRSTRRLNLTDAGKSFYENAKRAIENVNQAELAARGDAGLSGTGVRVNAVAPGPVETGMLDRFTGSAEVKAALVGHVPLKRTGTSEEIGQAIVFMGSDSASFITGTILGVDGGMLA
jgi:NAD(P)-dependent dehydrogenase (short-subunit alcohol dehydrogenase family)